MSGTADCTDDADRDWVIRCAGSGTSGAIAAGHAGRKPRRKRARRPTIERLFGFRPHFLPPSGLAGSGCRRGQKCPIHEPVPLDADQNDCALLSCSSTTHRVRSSAGSQSNPYSVSDPVSVFRRTRRTATSARASRRPSIEPLFGFRLSDPISSPRCKRRATRGGTPLSPQFAFLRHESIHFEVEDVILRVAIPFRGGRWAIVAGGRRWADDSQMI
jgi:hypothetical protein